MRCTYVKSNGSRCRREGPTKLCWQHITGSLPSDSIPTQKGGTPKRDTLLKFNVAFQDHESDPDVSELDVQVFKLFYDAHASKTSEGSKKGRELNTLLQTYRTYLLTDDKDALDRVKTYLDSKTFDVSRASESRYSQLIQVGGKRSKGKKSKRILFESKTRTGTAGQKGGASPSSEEEKIRARRREKEEATPPRTQEQRQLLLGKEIEEKTHDRSYSQNEVDRLVTRAAEEAAQRVMSLLGPEINRLRETQEASKTVGEITQIKVEKGNKTLDSIDKNIKDLRAGTIDRRNYVVRVMTAAFKWLCVMPIKTSYSLFMTLIIRPFIFYPVKLVVKIGTRYAAITLGVVILLAVGNRVLYWYAHLSDHQKALEEYCYTSCPSDVASFAQPQCDISLYGPGGREDAILCDPYTRDTFNSVAGYLLLPIQALAPRAEVAYQVVFKDWAGFRIYFGDIVDVIYQSSKGVYDAASSWLTETIKTVSYESVKSFLAYSANKVQFWKW